MRILYIHQFFAMRDSSHPTRSYEFARRMAADGHEVWMVTGSSRLPEPHRSALVSRFDVDGIRVLSARNTYSNYMSVPSRILSFVRFMIAATWLASTTPRPDVVLATSTPLTVAVPGYIASRLRRAPYVFEVRDPWPDAAFEMGALREQSLIGRAARWLERFTYAKADAIVALSPGMEEYVLRQARVRDKMRMIPNCADTDLFHPGPKDPEMVQRFDLDGRVVVAYAGAIGPSNSVSTIVEAARIIAEKGRDDVLFLLVGDGKCLPEIREQVETLGLHNVRIAGSVPKHDMPALLRSCDILLSHLAKVPVLYTGSPNKLFDALASGKPVIVNSPGWTAPLIVDSGAGLFVEPEDENRLADAVMSLADDPAERERMGARARELALRGFNRDQKAEEMIALLAEVARR